MIGNYKGVVKNRVITALLQAYLDVLDYDGMKSILKEAGLLDLKNNKGIDPNETIDFISFKKIIYAQNSLLYYCYDLLFEIGKKFSFYLFPYGKKFDEIVEEINDLIKTDWKVHIIKKTSKNFSIKIEKCVFCSEIGVPCDLFIGFLVHSLEKSLPSDKKVISSREVENVNQPEHNSYIIKLKWKSKVLQK